MIKLGNEVIDPISGFRGVATGRTEYLYSVTRIEVEPRELKDGIPYSPVWFDEARLELWAEDWKRTPPATGFKP